MIQETRSSIPDSADLLSDRDLVMHFESLGGNGHGSEFGLFQRHCGADPLGLLRWSDLGPELLIQALQARFDGVGAPENTIIFAPDGSDEWWTKDKRYWMATRSFIKTADMTLEQITAHVARRQPFLRRKLVDDLEAGEKIFVFRNLPRPLTDDELARLHAAVRGYGDTTLLYVRVADDAFQAGTVTRAAPGLLIGAMDHFAFSPDNVFLGSAEDGWRTLCRRAYAMAQEAAPPPPAATPPVEPPPPPATVTRPRVRAALGRRIVMIGNCQVNAIAGLYKRFVAARTGDTVEVIASYNDMTERDRSSVEQADIIVEQVLDLKPQADTEGLAASKPRLLIPAINAAFLWPFAGQPHPRNQSYPFMAVGPYGREAGDSYLNRMILANKDPEEAVDAYMALDVRKRVNLDRLYELVMDRQRSRDAITGYRFADLIEAHFRTEPLFLSPYHPNLRMALALATQFFEKIGADPADIARMQAGTRVTPFPKDELPLHPSVCAHFGLTFVTPERRYRFMNEGRFTAREYALRYMRYEWNDALEEGISLLQAGRHDSAEQRLRTALETSPDSAAAWSALGHVLLHRGAREDAIAATRRAVALEPETPAYHANLGNLLRQTGAYLEAEAELRLAIEADPVDSHFYGLLSHLLNQTGQSAGAIETLRQAIAVDPFAPRLHAELANLLVAAGDAEGAIAALEDLIALQPASAEAHHKLALMLGRLNRLEAAVAAAERAVALDPDPGPLRIAYSDLLIRAGRTEEGLTEAYVAAVADPASADAYTHLGTVLRKTNDHAGAESAFRKAAELDPRNAHAHHELSIALTQQGRLQEAAGAAREAVALEPRNPRRHAHLANFLARANDLPGAVAAQREAIALDPADVGARLVLSDFLARQGQLPDALQAAQAVVDANPNSGHAAGHLGHLLQLSGDLRRAETVFRKAIELDPHNDHLRRQLDQVQERIAHVPVA